MASLCWESDAIGQEPKVIINHRVQFNFQDTSREEENPQTVQMISNKVRRDWRQNRHESQVFFQIIQSPPGLILLQARHWLS